MHVAWQSVFKKLKKVRGLSDHERILFARSLAATPDERWRMHETFLRSHGLYKYSERRAFGFRSTPNIGGPLNLHWLGRDVAMLPLPRIIKSKAAVRRPKDLAHLPLLRQTLRPRAART